VSTPYNPARVRPPSCYRQSRRRETYVQLKPLPSAHGHDMHAASARGRPQCVEGVGVNEVARSVRQPNDASEGGTKTNTPVVNIGVDSAINVARSS